MRTQLKADFHFEALTLQTFQHLLKSRKSSERNWPVKMLQIYFLFFPTFAKVAHSAPRDETPEEWARDQTNRRFEQEAHRGPPWEDYNKQGFFSRAPQSRLGLAESDRQNALPPTRTPHDLAPTRTYASLTRRAPQTSADLGTFTCIPGKDCYTFSCKFAAPTSVDRISCQ